MGKRIKAMVLVPILSMVILLFGSAAAYADGAATLSMESVAASPGSTVTVNVAITDNPGILGCTMKVDYDERLTLNKGQNGEAFAALSMTTPGKLVPGCKFAWDGQDLDQDQILDGTALSLTFTVPEGVASGEELAVSVTCSDPIDVNLQSVNLTEATVSGKIIVQAFIYGDANGDENVNMTDVILMRRFIAGGYDVSINEDAADVNLDNKVNMTDVILIRRFVAGGYDIILPYQSGGQQTHTHTLAHSEKVDPTCTESGTIEYWKCSSCGKYYTDANGLNEISEADITIAARGHIPEVIPRVEPTTTTTGLTEGSRCSVCGKILVEQEVIPVLEDGDHYSITYSLYDGDKYLENVGIDTSSLDTFYVAGKGIKQLKEPVVDGYTFEGWYDGQGAYANRIASISSSETGNIYLYAHWTPDIYDIYFDSPLVPQDKMTYTVKAGAILPTPSLYRYTFMGWSDEHANIIDRIPKGTTGDIFLTANWTSDRNQTIRKKNPGAPQIIEDSDNGQYLFVYEIGRIENVLINEIKDFGNTSGVSITDEETVSVELGKETSKTIVETLSNTTTRSNTWTLSKEWNDSLSQTVTHTDENGNVTSTSREKVESDSTVSALGGSFSSKNGVVATTSHDVTGTVKGTVEVGVGAGKIGGEVGGSISDTETNEVSKEFSWNVDSSVENSKSSSKSESTSQTISRVVSDSWGYNKTHSEGGSEVISNSEELSSTKQDEYASSLVYSNAETTTQTRTYSTSSDAPEGHYKLYSATTIHVFAVVGYDLATNSYYTYAFGVQDDDVYDYVDFERKGVDAEPNSGVLPFEVPFEVHEYMKNVLRESDGLEVDKASGVITGYHGDATNVVVPDYIVVSDASENPDVVKITGISSGAFKNNASIETVKLGKYVTEIPDNAFEGCTSLTKVTVPKLNKIGNSAFRGCISLTSVSDLVASEENETSTIGNNAFDGCTALDGYTVGTNVTSIGTDSFKGVKRLTVDAVSADMVRAACASGAKSIAVNTAGVSGELANSALSVPATAEYFEWNGGGETYTDVTLSSKAAKTVINKVSITNSKLVPLTIDSAEVVIGETTVDSPTWAMIMGEGAVTMTIESNVSMASSGTGVILTKPLTIKRNSSATTATLSLNGDLYVCGTESDVSNPDNVLNFTNGEIIPVSASQFEDLMNDSIEWVLESEMPTGAKVIATKWTYDETTTKTSSSNTMSGYELYDTTWVWGSYGNWSGWQNNAVSSSDSREVQTQVIPATYKTQYNYSRWYATSGGVTHYGPVRGTWSGLYCGNYQESGWLDSPLAVTGSQYSNQVGGTFNIYSGNWFNQSTHQVTVTAAYTQYRYRDRSKVYTYHFKKVENKESETEVTAGDNISNVQKWVKFVVQ